MTELKELGTMFLKNRVWVWPDNPISDDGNAGTFERPYKTYEHARILAEQGHIIIVIPPKKEIFQW